MNIGGKTVTMIVNDKKTKKTKVYQRILMPWEELDSRNPVNDCIIDMMESYLYEYECDRDECVSFELPKFKKLNNGFKIYRYDSRTYGYSFEIVVGESMVEMLPIRNEEGELV